MAGGLLNVGLSGLLATQRALTVTGHNISNANTEGYSRQRVGLTSRLPQLYGSSYVGNGVDVGAVSRIYDYFLIEQVLSSANSLVDRFKYVNDRLSELRQQTNKGLQDAVTQINTLAGGIADLNQNIDSALGASGGGLPNDLLDKRDAALAQLSKLVSVTSIPQSDGSMSVFIGSGQALVVGAKTQTLTVTRNHFDPTRNEIGFNVGSNSVEITNQLSGGSVGGIINFRNQVLDPAQSALGRVAASVADTMNTQHQLNNNHKNTHNGKLFNAGSPAVAADSVNAGSGTVSAALVNSNGRTTSDYRLAYNGANSYTLTRINDGQAFAIDTGGSSPYTTASIDGISLTISSGAAAGDTFLVRPTFAAVTGMSVAVSDVTKIAAAAPIRASASLSNVGNATISAGAGNSPDDRLVVQFTAAGTYDVLDETTGATLAQGLSYTSGGNIAFNGLSFKITNGGSGPATGDTFYVDEKITSADSANTGGAAIGQVTVSVPDPHLRDSVSIVFTSPTTFNVVGATTGNVVTNVAYTSGDPISYNGWNLKITGAPVTGDTFTVGPNNNGGGDNRNALLLSGLQQKLTMVGGTASYQDAYGQIVADVGSKAQQAQIERNARETLLKQSVEARDSVSGVNLDEEAANIVKMQQAYQAAARVISTADNLFQSLLDAVR